LHGFFLFDRSWCDLSAEDTTHHYAVHRFSEKEEAEEEEKAFSFKIMQVDNFKTDVK